MTLKTLEEHNAEIARRMFSSVSPTLNGIACPKCGEEMSDEPDVVLTSMPPQYPIYCGSCGHTDKRL